MAHPALCLPNRMRRVQGKSEPGTFSRLAGHVYPAAVWLNPVPSAQWGYTQSVKLIKQLMNDRMYPLTLAGLDDAMRELTRKH